MSAPARRPRIAFFTPLPPVQSGISQYSAELLPLLGEALTIDVYVDGYRPTVELGSAASLLPAGRFERNHAARPYDLIVYQMGNSPAHAYMWPLALRHPGLLVLHDYVLHHLNVWMAVNRGGVKQYQAEMLARYGEPGRAAALRTLRGQMPASVFDYPLCEAVVERSRLVAVHNAYAARLVAERCGCAVERIPMGVPLYHLPAAKEARARLGLPAEEPVLASLGELSPHKRLDTVLRAFVRLRERHPGALIVLAGRESPGLNLARQARMLGLEGAVVNLGYIEEASVPDLLAAADVVVNLRYPTAGETSASLLRLLAAAKAVVVTRAGSMQEVPPAACVHIPADAIEEELLAEVLLRLVEEADLRAAIGRYARAFIEREHTLVHAAGAYLGLIGLILGVELPLPDSAPPILDARAGGPQLPAGPATALAAPEPALVVDAVATAMAHLGLDRAPAVGRAAARALVALGLTPTAQRHEEPPWPAGCPGGDVPPG